MVNVWDESGGATCHIPAWLARVRVLHTSAKAGALPAAGLQNYREMREDLMQVLLVGQQIMREFGHTARQTVRVAIALQVDLCFPGHNIRASTLDVSMGGFSALLGTAPRAGIEMKLSLRIPGTEPVRGAARVIASIPRNGDARVSFQFSSLADDGRERLSSFIFDTILNRLSPRHSRATPAPAEASIAGT